MPLVFASSTVARVLKLLPWLLAPQQYVNFLDALKDDANARALCERALDLLPVDQSEAVWTRYLAFEESRGDLAAVLRVQERRRQALQSDTPFGVHTLPVLLQRYTVVGMHPATEDQVILPLQANVPAEITPISRPARFSRQSRQSARCFTSYFVFRFHAQLLSFHAGFRPHGSNPTPYHASFLVAVVRYIYTNK